MKRILSLLSVLMIGIMFAVTISAAIPDRTRSDRSAITVFVPVATPDFKSILRSGESPGAVNTENIANYNTGGPTIFEGRSKVCPDIVLRA